MNLNRWIRQTHRWVSIFFTLAVIANGIEVFRGKYSNAMGLAALLPLAFLLLTGLYLFALPYFAKSRGGRVAG